MNYYYAIGEIENWPSKIEMLSLLQKENLDFKEGHYSVWYSDEETNISFEEYGGDLGEPSFQAESTKSLKEFIQELEVISKVLTKNKIINSFEIYNGEEKFMCTLNEEETKS
jgi:hypothetical protein